MAFDVPADAYDRFMGRWLPGVAVSRAAEEELPFADAGRR